jgi:TonB family protein
VRNPLIILTMTALLAAGCASSPADSPPPTSAAAADRAAASPAPTSRPSSSVIVTASALNVRRGPSVDAEVVAKVNRGDELTVIGTNDRWTNVRLANGNSGWVSSEHVSVDGLLREAPRRTATTKPKRPGRAGCPADADFSFVKTPLPSFTEIPRPGLVVVDASVDAKGNVVSSKIVSNSTGDPELARLAEREIKTAKFAPPIRNCAPRAFIFSYKRSF